MNRRKKINQTLLKKAKKANAKKQVSNKPRYLSKAERARMEAEAENCNAASGSDESAVTDFS